MADFQELLVCLASGLILLVLMLVFIGNNFLNIEVPLLGKVPLGIALAVAISLYGCFGLIVLGTGKIITQEFIITPEIQKNILFCAIITSYFFGKIMMQMFQETPHKPFCDRALGLIATVRYTPRDRDQPGDALVFDPQEKITQIITIYLADWAEEITLQRNDSVRIIDYLPTKQAFLTIKTGGVDEFTWQHQGVVSRE